MTANQKRVLVPLALIVHSRYALSPEAVRLAWHTAEDAPIRVTECYRAIANSLNNPTRKNP